MNWIDAKAKYDHGSRLIKAGLELMQEYLDMVKDEKENDLTDNRESRHGDADVRTQEGRR